MVNILSVLIPTYNREASLAVVLTSLALQRFPGFNVIISDQSRRPVLRSRLVRAALEFLQARGMRAEVLRNLPRRGLAQQRQFLLDRAQGKYALFLDDDVLLEPYALLNAMRMLRRQQCGFVGAAVMSLAHLSDVRPREQRIEFWNTRVVPERVTPEGREWRRHSVHNAANLLHVAKRLGITHKRPRAYKVAWVGGCVLYDVQKLRAAGGFTFWRNVPAEHAGEDAYAQLRVMARFGGCGIVPSGAYHIGLPTTVANRQFNLPNILPL